MTYEWTRFRHSARLVLPFVVLLAALAWLVWPTLDGIVSRWFKFDESYSHGLLLLLISVVLVVRAALRNPVTPGFYPWWLVPFALALVAYALGDILRVQALQELTIVPLLLGTLAILLGWHQVRQFILPVGILFLAVPVWDYLSWPLQLVTVEINELLLGLFGIDFEIEGVFVYLIGVGAFEVAHGCSGLRYLLVGQALVLLYGELNLRRLRSRILLYITGVVLSLAANWVRVFVIIYMGYETNMETSLIKDHDNFGWWVFAATLVPMFLVGRRLENSEDREAGENHAVAGNPSEAETVRPASQKRAWVGAVVASIFPIVVAAGLPAGHGNLKPVPESYSFDFSTGRYGSLFVNHLSGWKPQVRNPDWVFTQAFFDRQAIDENAGAGETLYIGVYSYEYQRHRAELIQYWNRLYERDTWLPENFFTVEGPGGVSLQGVTLRDRVSRDLVTLAYGYYVEGHWETEEWKAKFAQILGFFSGRSDASLLAFGVACEACDGKEAVQSLVDDTMGPIVRGIDRKFTGED